MLNVVMLNVIMLNVVMLSVVMLSVKVPVKLDTFQTFQVKRKLSKKVLKFLKSFFFSFSQFLNSP
jgi:hypothetical protein